MLEQINPDTKYEVNNGVDRTPTVLLVRKYKNHAIPDDEEWMPVMEAMIALADGDDNGVYESARIVPVNVDMGYWDRSM